jgi:hypothetical protein
MATTTNLLSSSPAHRAPHIRDLRLDMFRGLALLLIAVTHMGGNWLAEILPSHFGFSSGTDMFVFCSGVASGLAFGNLFVKRGFWLGTVRVAHRIWQIYWAHIASFVAVLALTIYLASAFGRPYYVTNLQHDVLLTHPRQALLGLVSLTYLPPLFDILPIYIVMLAMIPAVMAARLLGNAVPFLVVGVAYLLVWTVGIHLPANPTVPKQAWLFNPFAWQLLFFAGFFIAMRWIPVPAPGTPWATATAVLIVFVSVPLSWRVLTDNFAIFATIRDAIVPASERTNFHPVRLVHFLATAYLAVSVIAAYPRIVTSLPARILATTGRETLAAFLASIPIAILGGTLLDLYGASPRLVVAGTALSWGGIVGTALVASYVKSKPWSKAAVAGEQPARGVADRGAAVRGIAVSRLGAAS